MLHLLGIFLKLLITCAIGILGFTWEPKGKTGTLDEIKPKSPVMEPVLLILPAPERQDDAGRWMSL